MFELVDIVGVAPDDCPAATAVQTLTLRICGAYTIVSNDNYLFVKDGLYYTPLTKKEFTREFMHLYMEARPDWRPKLGVQGWETISHIHYTAEVDFYPNLIPFSNGIYDITTKVFTTDTTDIFISKPLSMEYIPNATAPLFMTAITEIIPNEDDRVWFLTFMNYCFGGDISRQVALILMGGGNNGKTVLMEFIIKLMGKRATTTRLKKLGDDAVRCSLNGRTMCYSSEIGGSYLQQDIMEDQKEMITEKNKSGRRPYMQIEEWENTTKFVCATNNLPKLQVYERAYLRRWKIIDFPTDFTGREDRTIFERIFEVEGAEVMNYILQQFNNHEVLSIDWHETEEIWRNNANPVKRFLDKMCVINIDTNTETDSIYASYVKFCVGGEVSPLSRQYFSRQMTKLGFPPTNMLGCWEYIGLGHNINATDPKATTMNVEFELHKAGL